MPHLEPEESMVAWAVSACLTAVLVLGFVLPYYLAGSFEELGASVLIYLGLWAPSFYCSWRAVAVVGLGHRAVPINRLLRSGPYWGGWTGVIIAFLFYVGFVVLAGSYQGISYLPIAAVFFLYPAFFGMAVGFVIGWLVGLVATLVVVWIWQCARIVIPPSPEDSVPLMGN